MAALLKHFPSLTRFTPVFSQLCQQQLKSTEFLYTGLCLIQKRNFKPKWVAPTLRALKNRKDYLEEKNGGPKIFHRSTFLEWNYDAEIFAFGNRLGEKFDDNLLRKALTHRSYIEQESLKLGVNPDVRLSPNDDLAASGIPIISKSIKGYLRAVFTRTPEEFIMTLHDHLMTTSLMAHVAKHIGLSDIILCTDFPCKEETLAKTLHAVVAALVQSSGEERARIFVQDLIVTQLYGKDVNEIWNPVDPVGILRSILAREGRAEAEFRLIRKAGSDTILSVYHVGIYSDRNLIGTGTGENVQVAQEMASRDALKRLFLTDDAMKALPFGRQLKSMRGKIVECESRPNISLSEWTLEKAARSV